MTSMLFKGRSRVHKTVILLMSFLFLYGVSTASANTLLQGKVVSISYNPSSGDLFTAYSRALYRLDTHTHKWVSIALPTSVQSIASVVAGGSGSLYLATSGAGVLHSEDGGKSWEPRNDGLSSKDASGLVRHAQQPDTLYAVIAEEGIFRSENGGGEWLLMDGGPDNMTDLIIHSDMPDSMQTGWIFAATKTGVSRSMDCFCLWSEAGDLTGEITGLTYNPKQPAHVYAATKQGIFRSQDGGQNWLSLAPIKADITALLLTDAGELYAGTQSGALFIRDAQADTWEPLDVF